MGEKTAISWTDHTWNPWRGCTRISAGCAHCYMFRDAKRYGLDPDQIVRSKTTFNAPLNWKEPAKVFTCSWSDFFHENVPVRWLNEAWEIIKQTPHLTYQILTKRPYEIANCLPDDWGEGYPNVWLGVTVEDYRYEWRMEALDKVKCKLRFVSYEPAVGMLSPLFIAQHKIDWLIAGGESGPDARVPNPDWFTDILNDCKRYKIPFYFKQWGGNKKIDGVWGSDILFGKQYHEFPQENAEKPNEPVHLP